MAIIFIPDRLILTDLIDDPESKKSDGAKAFNHMIELQSICGCEIFIPSQMKTKLLKRFKDDHKASFFSHVDVDYSTDGTEGYDSYNSYQWLVPKKARNVKNIVVFIAKDVRMYTFGDCGIGNCFFFNSEIFIKLARSIILITETSPYITAYDSILKDTISNFSKNNS